MKLLSYKYNGQVQIGALVGAQIVPAGADLPGNMLDFLAAGESAKLALQKQIAADGERIALSDVQLLAPIPRPGKLLGVGLNYADHR